MIQARRRLELPRTTAWGAGLALAAGVISGASIVINGIAVRELADPLVYTTLKNGVAAAVLIAVALVAVRPADVRAIHARGWAWLAIIGVVGGSVPFLLFFSGLAQASAPAAAFIQKTLFVWVALLAVPLLRERLGLGQLAALGVLLAGQALVQAPTGITWGTGETLIAAATLLWAVETVVARRVLRSVPAPVVGAARLGFGLVVLVGALAVGGRLSAVAALAPAQWVWVVVTGVILSAYVATWFAALRRAPASLVTAVLVVGAPITAAIQGGLGGAVPAPTAIAGQVLLLAGVVLLLLRARRPAPVVAPATNPGRAG